MKQSSLLFLSAIKLYSGDVVTDLNAEKECEIYLLPTASSSYINFKTPYNVDLIKALSYKQTFDKIEISLVSKVDGVETTVKTFILGSFARFENASIKVKPDCLLRGLDVTMTFTLMDTKISD